MNDISNNGGGYSFTESQLGLLRTSVPTIDIFGEVDKKMFIYVRNATMMLRAKGSPDINIAISSPGGSVDVGLDIYDALRLYEGKKTATVYDQAASMGALIVQACEVRRCARHSHMLIHHVSRSNVTLDVLRSNKKLQELRENMERSQTRLYAILSQKTGRKVTDIRRVCAKDEFMTSEEALAFGLIDEII